MTETKDDSRYTLQARWTLPRWAVEEEPEFADWKIELQIPKEDGSDDATVTYSVHRFILGSSCAYFNRLFHDTHFTESETQTSRIRLPSCNVVSRTHFETFLDYLYDGKASLSPENVIPFAYFSDYFQISGLDDDIYKYIAGFVHYKHCAVLNYKAGLLGLGEIQTRIARRCAKHPIYMEMDAMRDDITEVVAFWHRVWEARTWESESKGEILEWSTNLARFLQFCSSEIDQTKFQFFTNRIRCVSIDAAFALMEQEKSLKLDKIDCDYMGLTRLQYLCMEPIRKRMHLYLNSPSAKTRLMGNLRKLSPVVYEYFVSHLIDGSRLKVPPLDIEIVGAEEDVNGIYSRKVETKHDGESCKIQYTEYRNKSTTIRVHNGGNDHHFQICERSTLLYKEGISIEGPRRDVLPPVDGWKNSDGTPAGLEILYISSEYLSYPQLIEITGSKKENLIKPTTSITINFEAGVSTAYDAMVTDLNTYLNYNHTKAIEHLFMEDGITLAPDPIDRLIEVIAINIHEEFYQESDPYYEEIIEDKLRKHMKLFIDYKGDRESISRDGNFQEVINDYKMEYPELNTLPITIVVTSVQVPKNWDPKDWEKLSDRKCG